MPVLVTGLQSLPADSPVLDELLRQLCILLQEPANLAGRLCPVDTCSQLVSQLMAHESRVDNVEFAKLAITLIRNLSCVEGDGSDSELRSPAARGAEPH